MGEMGDTSHCQHIATSWLDGSRSLLRVNRGRHGKQPLHSGQSPEIRRTSGHQLLLSGPMLSVHRALHMKICMGGQTWPARLGLRGERSQSLQRTAA